MNIINSLRFQFIVLFSVFVIALSTVTSVLGIQRISEEVVEAFAMQGIRLVEETASIIDGDSFEALSKSLDRNYITKPYESTLLLKRIEAHLEQQYAV